MVIFAREHVFVSREDLVERGVASVKTYEPFRIKDLELKNRIVVSPMAQYKAVDGCPTDWHFAHYAERAKGGAGLVYVEMTCVSPEGRITPGCPGLYDPRHEAEWKRIVDFVHGHSDAKIGLQLGHAGAPGVLFDHYRALAKPKDARAFWRIKPKAAKVVPFPKRVTA